VKDAARQTLTLREVLSMARAPMIEELFYDPLGGWADGSSIGPIGGHGSHVHVALIRAAAMMRALRVARRKFGLRVGENPFYGGSLPTGGHTSGSWHYQAFPGLYRGKRLGKAADISGDPAKMAAYTRWVLSKYGGQLAVPGGSAPAGGGSGGGGSMPSRPKRPQGRSRAETAALMQSLRVELPEPQLDFTDPATVVARFAPRSRTLMAAAPEPIVPNENAELLAELRRQLLGDL